MKLEERYQYLLEVKSKFERALQMDEAAHVKFTALSQHEKFKEQPAGVQASHNECIAMLDESIPKNRARIAELEEELKVIKSSIDTEMGGE